MSKKDYQAIARALHALRVDEQVDPDALAADRGARLVDVEVLAIAADLAAEAIADVLAADNPRFDRARFIEACETGLDSGMRK